MHMTHSHIRTIAHSLARTHTFTYKHDYSGNNMNIKLIKEDSNQISFSLFILIDWFVNISTRMYVQVITII